MANYPKRGQVYTLRVIKTALKLDDSPHLGFWLDLGEDEMPTESGRTKVECVIQTSHVCSSDLLTVPGFADSLWRYRYTTSEWIPVFEYADEKSIREFVDIEHSTYWYDLENNPNSQWVTPKGFPRRQHE